MTYRLQQILPPRWALALFALVYFLLEAEGLWVQAIGWPAERIAIMGLQQGLVLVGCGLYGAYRALAFHPLVRPSYMKWLKATPWRAGLPTPLGPMHVVWQDTVVVLIALLLVLRGPEEYIFEALLACLIPYLLGLATLFLITDQRRLAYGLLFGLGLAIRLVGDPVVALLVAMALYTVAYLGLRQALASFPWNEKTLEKLQSFRARLSQPAGGRTTRWVGWPFYQTKPHDPGPKIGLELGTAISLLVGWYLHVFFQLTPPDIGEPLVVPYGVLFGAPVVRLILYCVGYRSPISIWGRIFTLRWIIPGYDRVFVAPVCALLAGLAVQSLLGRLGVPIGTTVPITVAVVLFLTLNMPPTLGNWRLSGSHRMTAGLFREEQGIRI